MREWVKHADILNVAIPMVWEGLGRNIRGKEQDVNAVVMIDANLHPDDIRLDNANDSKVTFIRLETSKRVVDISSFHLANLV